MLELPNENVTISQVIEMISKLGDVSTSIDLKQAVSSLLQYESHIDAKLKNERLLALTHSLDELSKSNPNFTFESRYMSGVSVLTFNDKYVFNYTTLKDYDELIGFLVYLIDIYPFMGDVNIVKELTSPSIHPVMQLGFSDNHDSGLHVRQSVPLVKTVRETIVLPAADLAKHTHTNVTLYNEPEHSSVKDEPRRANAEDVVKAKQSNVEHMRKVKQSIDAKNDIAKEERVIKRMEPIDNYISSHYNYFDTIKNSAEKWLLSVDGNDKLLDVLELAQQINTDTHINDLGLIRVIMEVVSINLSNKLIPIASFKETDKQLYLPMSSHDKELMLGVALVNLDSVRKQEKFRDYNDVHLIVHIIEYCNKNSSLTITETPEEIAQLAKVMYDVLLSKNLNSDYVYAADVNNQLDSYDSRWFMRNNVVRSYLDKIKETCENTKQDDVMSLIETIMNRRDVTMSNPRLATKDVTQLFNVLQQLPIYDSEEHVRYGYSNNVYVVGGRYPIGNGNQDINFNHAFIVATEECIAVIINIGADSHFQEFYVQENASKLVKWLEYFIPTQLGDL